MSSGSTRDARLEFGERLECKHLELSCCSSGCKGDSVVEMRGRIAVVAVVVVGTVVVKG